MIRIFKNLGRYDYCSSNKDWKVEFVVKDIFRISGLWPEDEEPIAERPSEWVGVFKDRLERTFYSDKKRDKLRLAWAEDHADELDRLWILDKLDRLDKEKEKLMNELKEE